MTVSADDSSLQADSLITCSEGQQPLGAVYTLIRKKWKNPQNDFVTKALFIHGFFVVEVCMLYVCTRST